MRIGEKTAGKFILTATICAFITGLVTFINILVRMFGFNPWNYIDVALFWGLGFGIFKKSRTCAIIVFLLYMAGRVDMWFRIKDPVMVFGLIPIIFVAAYFLGILGTFAYHNQKNGKTDTAKPE